MPKPRLKIPNLGYSFEGNARYQYTDAESGQTIQGQYEYFNAENNKELQGAIGRTRARIKKAVGRIAGGEYKLPSSTMDALYRLDAQLGKLNHELILGNDEVADKESVPQWWLQKDFPELVGKDIKSKFGEQFEFMDGIADYERQMDTLARMGELLNERTTDKAGNEGPSILAFLYDDDGEKTKKDIEILQNNLFVTGTELLNGEAYDKYSELYGPKKTGDPDVRRTAAEWIEQSKQDAFLSHDGDEYQKDLSVPARIIAARQLAGAERGKKDKLGAELSEQELLTRAAELESDDTFRKIMSKADVAMEVEACRKNARSNGGALEDAMKREMRRLPPGRLPNKPLFTRYMPTIKDRIEVLQKMAKKGGDEMTLRCAAEIMALRGIQSVKRGDVKTLKTPIPTDSISSLRAKTDAFLSDPKFWKAMKDPQVLAALQSGHGGKMEELLKAKMAEKKAAPIADDLAPADPYSFGGRLSELRRDAQAFVSEVGSAALLENMGKEQKRHYMSTAKRMIASYIAFDQKCRDPKDRTKLDDGCTKAFAGSTAQMNQIVSKVAVDEDFEKRLDNMGAKEIFNVMKEMGEKPQKEFMETMLDNDLVPESLYPNAPKVETNTLQNKPTMGASKVPG